MTLSIIIPTFNRNKDLIITLNHLKTCLVNFEFSYQIIVIDNNSLIDPLIEINKIKGINIEFFRNSSNIGISRSILEGMLKAKGEYSWIYGDDDFVHSEVFKFLEKKLFDENDFIQMARDPFKKKEDLICKLNESVEIIKVETLDLKNINHIVDSDCGFITSNIFKTKLFFEAVETISKRGSYLDNNYWIRLVNNELLIRSNKSIRLQNKLVYQKIIEGSHFYKDADLVFKTFFEDMNEVFIYHNNFNKEWPDNRSFYFNNKFDLVIVKMFANHSTKKIMKAFKFSNYKNLFSLVLLFLPKMVVKKLYIFYKKVKGDELPFVFLNNVRISENK